MAFTDDEVDFHINHIFLPPKLPQANDGDPRLENVLLRLVADAADTFANLVPDDQQPAVRQVATTISQLIASRDKNGAVAANSLLQALGTLTTAPSGE